MGYLVTLLLRKKEVEALFTRVTPVVVDMSSGKVMEGVDPESVNERKEAKESSLNIALAGSDDIAKKFRTLLKE